MLGLGWRSLYHESWPLRKRLTGTVSVQRPQTLCVSVHSDASVPASDYTNTAPCMQGMMWVNWAFFQLAEPCSATHSNLAVSRVLSQAPKQAAKQTRRVFRLLVCSTG